jgi:uncharacterized membrane protein
VESVARSTFKKTITIDAPVEQVFGFWTAYENFPRFMSRVLEVRPTTREGQSHWTVSGPAGVPVEFDAEVSAFVPNEVLKTLIETGRRPRDAAQPDVRSDQTLPM